VIDIFAGYFVGILHHLCGTITREDVILSQYATVGGDFNVVLACILKRATFTNPIFAYGLFLSNVWLVRKVDD
jgi:uncharacterized membrane protein